MRQLWGACVVLALFACGGNDDVGPRETPDEGRGSAKCRLWQDSICDWAERCEAVAERKLCDEQFQGVTCKSDAVASKCADAFDEASCQSLPPRCGLDEVADPVPAAEACDTLTSRFCEHATECGVGASKEACLAATNVDCSRSIAVKLNYENCLETVDELQCEDMNGPLPVMLPEVCERVIISSAP